MKILNTHQKNAVLTSMMEILNNNRKQILNANQKDLAAFDKNDQALYDRLVVDDKKINGMIAAIQKVKDQEDPVGNELSKVVLDSGLKIINKTDPFGTILIIYESRPDVTIEAAVLAFKANNKILLKGGKEAKESNFVLIQCWHQALEENGLEKDWITALQMNRQETQGFLMNPTEKLDLIVPRGGERLIDFVKQYAQCAVLVSGRGNNFLYVSKDADWEKSISVIVNAKTDKISGCNALDKVLIDERIPDFEDKVKELVTVLKNLKVEIVTSDKVAEILPNENIIKDENVWYEEFLAYKIVIASIKDEKKATQKINKYSGKHSACIMTEDPQKAKEFMEEVDCAAVYHNASTRFTDGGQMGVGAELAISTDKLHHRGPLGLKQLVTNKYYVFGDGHIRN